MLWQPIKKIHCNKAQEPKQTHESINVENIENNNWDGNNTKNKTIRAWAIQDTSTVKWDQEDKR